MKRVCLVILSLCAGGGSQAMAQGVQQRLENALGFEWFMSNCEEAQSASGMLAVSAAMTINGHTVGDVEATRAKVQEQIKAAYPNPADACAAVAAELPKQ